ncbi:MAG: NAD(P)-dependent oxidoreductase [Geminicoccaceae bacterium]
MVKAYFDNSRCWDCKPFEPAPPRYAEVLFINTPKHIDLYQYPKAKLVACACTTQPQVKLPRGRPMAFLTLYGDPILEQITSTVDHTWCLILALNNRLIKANTDVLNGRWDRFSNGRPSMLSDMRLGVVGYGRIGMQVLRIGTFFGMETQFINSTPDRAWLEDCDIVTLHTPPSIGPVLDRRNMDGITHGCLIINTAQGNAVCQWELIDALDSGRCGGAALDVLPGEFEPGFNAAEHPLVKYAQDHDNLLLTPHIGGSSRDAWGMTQRRIVEKAAQWCKENL